MKQPLLTVTSLLLAAGASFAGDHSKVVETPAPPPPLYGTGFYLGIQAGVNAYQDSGGDRSFSFGDSDISPEARDKTGFVGGLKAGYVFGTGTVRPAVEADFYYNGVGTDVDAQINGDD